MRQQSALLALSLILAALAALTAVAAEEPSAKAPLKVGDPAPDVVLIPETKGEDTSNPVKLSDFAGKKNVLLAFYPKAFTPGCTKQMCGYRDDMARFKQGETEVFAVSGDQQAESDRFKEEHQLPYAVIGDAEGAIAKAFAVPHVERNGVAYLQRSVFLIDKAGRIRYINLDYNVGRDAEPLFEAIEELGKADAEKENAPE